jgi:hypothetical protein
MGGHPVCGRIRMMMIVGGSVQPLGRNGSASSAKAQSSFHLARIFPLNQYASLAPAFRRSGWMKQRMFQREIHKRKKQRIVAYASVSS